MATSRSRSSSPSGSPSESSTPPAPGSVRRPCSQRKIEANRENARKSTGPRTAAGKARSRLNGFVHGLTASLSVMPGEDAATVRRFFANVYAELKPRGAAEAVLVDQYASIAWKLRRLGAAERSVAADRFGKDLGKWLAAVDNHRWCKKHRPRMMEDEDLGAPPDPPPGNMAFYELLSEELDQGNGPLLRLMELEMRLRSTLTRTLQQLKDLRALHKARAQDDADPEELTRIARAEWDGDDYRWSEAKLMQPSPAEAGKEGSPVPSEATAPPPSTEAAAPPDDAQAAKEPEVAPAAPVAHPVADSPAGDQGEPTQATENISPPRQAISSDDKGPESPPSSV